MLRPGRYAFCHPPAPSPSPSPLPFLFLVNQRTLTLLRQCVASYFLRILFQHQPNLGCISRRHGLHFKSKTAFWARASAPIEGNRSPGVWDLRSSFLSLSSWIPRSRRFFFLVLCSAQTVDHMGAVPLLILSLLSTSFHGHGWRFSMSTHAGSNIRATQSMRGCPEKERSQESQGDYDSCFPISSTKHKQPCTSLVDAGDSLQTSRGSADTSGVPTVHASNCIAIASRVRGAAASRMSYTLQT